MMLRPEVMTFSTIAVLAALGSLYRRQVSLKRSAHRSNFSGGIEADGTAFAPRHIRQCRWAEETTIRRPDRCANFVFDSCDDVDPARRLNNSLPLSRPRPAYRIAIAQDTVKCGYNHFFHRKMKYGPIAAATIIRSAIGSPWDQSSSGITLKFMP